jgi:lipid-binding SYLF domain-containing protein
MRSFYRTQMIAFALLAAVAVLVPAARAEAGSAAQIDASVEGTLNEFFHQIRGSRELVNKSAAVLVFPSVIKAGIGIGGEYGEGALLTRGRTLEYYNTVSASIGFQFGAQARSVIIVFMTPEALAGFRRVNGWKVGVDGSVAHHRGHRRLDRLEQDCEPIVGFIFDGKGLMYNLTLEGPRSAASPADLAGARPAASRRSRRWYWRLSASAAAVEAPPVAVAGAALR